MRKILLIIGCIIAIPAAIYLCLITYAAALWLLGYEIGHPPWELAEILVKEGRPVKDCYLYKTLDIPMRPSTFEQQTTCVYTYAKLKKDPTACESLMSVPYGFSCVGAATIYQPCVFLSNPEKTVKGNDLVTTLDQCISGPNAIKNNECCIIARITLQSGNTESCNSVKGSALLIDQCHHEVARKTKNISECALIASDNIRSACEVEVKALNQQ